MPIGAIIAIVIICAIVAAVAVVAGIQLSRRQGLRRRLRGNWRRIQASFVDDPRGSVAEAAALVDHAAQALAGVLRP